MLDAHLLVKCMEGVGYSAWVPKTRIKKSRGLKGLQLEVRAQRAHRLLVTTI